MARAEHLLGIERRHGRTAPSTANRRCKTTYGDRCMKRFGIRPLQQQFADVLVNAATGNRLTSSLGAFDTVALADVLRNQTVAASMVTDGHPLAATAAHHQALQ